MPTGSETKETVTVTLDRELFERAARRMDHEAGCGIESNADCTCGTDEVLRAFAAAWDAPQETRAPLEAFLYLFDRRVAKGVIDDEELINARREVPVGDQYTKENDMSNDNAIGTITITTEDIKEIEGGGCVTKETSDGVKVNVVFD
jgi:hypothetical protein